MALSNRKFVRLPPDGAGKRIGSFPVLYLEYNTGTTPFSEGQEVQGASSGTSGRILEVIEFSGTTGQLCIQLNPTSYDSVFTLGETLTVEGVPFAVAANTGVEVYYNEVVLVSGENPTHRQYIDERGAQYTTFADGSPRLDAFGRLKTSYPTIVGTYDFPYSSGLSKFTRTTGSGVSNIIHNASGSYALLQVDSSNGAEATITSNKYHTYIPGIGMSVIQTVVMGDTGKSGNIRRWGYFDEKDGFFWELSGSTLNVVVRSNASGTVVEHRVPQSQWSNDRLDGSETLTHNLSKFDLDITKNNIYTLDFQWLGAGRVRFGVVDSDGEAILVHLVENVNKYSIPYTSTANLPLRYENVNEAATAGTSEMKVICATVQADVPDYSDQLPKENYSYSAPSFIVSSSSEWTYLFAGQAGKTLLGKPNRALATITGASIYANQPIFLEVMKGGTINGAVWSTIYADTAAEFDLFGTPSGGTPVFSTIIDGADDLDLAGVFDKYRGETIKRKADLDATPTPYWVRAKLVSGSTPTNVAVAFNWTEYR